MLKRKPVTVISGAMIAAVIVRVFMFLFLPVRYCVCKVACASQLVYNFLYTATIHVYVHAQAMPTCKLLIEHICTPAAHDKDCHNVTQCVSV